MTIEGTVREILGYPTLFLIRDARIPAVNAPMNAAAAGGIADRSTSSSLSVFATARASFAFYNTEEDIDRFVQNLKEIRRKMGYGE